MKSMKKGQSCVVLMAMVLMLPVLCYSQEEGSSKATYYGSPDCKGTPRGACGYREYGRDVYDGNVAAVSRLYKDGAGCGACYLIKCKEAECYDDGVEVVVTDHGVSDDADFIMSAKAFKEMAQEGEEEQLMAYGHVEVEYKRVPCQYPGKNIIVKVHEHSHYPNYIALLLLYQGGVYDVTSLEVFEETKMQWRPCRRAYGAVWDMANPPRGALTVRFTAKAATSNELKTVLVAAAVPFYWQAGATYETSVQLS